MCLSLIFQGELNIIFRFSQIFRAKYLKTGNIKVTTFGIQYLCRGCDMRI